MVLPSFSSQGNDQREVPQHLGEAKEVTVCDYSDDDDDDDWPRVEEGDSNSVLHGDRDEKTPPPTSWKQSQPVGGSNISEEQGGLHNSVGMFSSTHHNCSGLESLQYLLRSLPRMYVPYLFIFLF